MSKINNINFVTVEGVDYINTTPHPVNCLDKEANLVVLPPCGVLVNATAVEAEVRTNTGITYVKTVFEANEDGNKFLDEVSDNLPNAVVIGSIIAAQAYPGRVFGLVPCKGYERVAPAEKRMRLDRFTTFE